MKISDLQKKNCYCALLNTILNGCTTAVITPFITQRVVLHNGISGCFIYRFKNRDAAIVRMFNTVFGFTYKLYYTLLKQTL